MQVFLAENLCLEFLYFSFLSRKGEGENSPADTEPRTFMESLKSFGPGPSSRSERSPGLLFFEFQTFSVAEVNGTNNTRTLESNLIGNVGLYSIRQKDTLNSEEQ